MNERIEQWIPWYVNGTLGANEHAEMDRHLATDAEARAEVALFTSAATAMKSSAARVPADRGLHEVLARIHADKATRSVTQPAKKPIGFLSTVVAWFGTSWTQPAFALALAIIGVQSVMLFRETPETMLMRGSNSATVPGMAINTSTAFLRVNFKPTATEGEMRILMAGSNANFAAGPGENGEYILSVGEKDALKALEIFKTSNIVASAASTLPPR